jgi:hypothetical protein
VSEILCSALLDSAAAEQDWYNALLHNVDDEASAKWLRASTSGVSPSRTYPIHCIRKGQPAAGQASRLLFIFHRRDMLEFWELNQGSFLQAAVQLSSGKTWWGCWELN